MEISNNLQCIYPQELKSRGTMGKPLDQGQNLPSKNSNKEPIVMNEVPSENIQGKPDLKEIAAEMLIKHEQLGEFKDKKGLEETTDLKIGPDIRYALKSCNVDFLKRIIKGPLTLAEYREVRYRLTELEQQYVTDNSIRKGHVIDKDHSLHAIMRGKAVENGKEDDNGHRSIVDVKV